MKNLLSVLAVAAMVLLGANNVTAQSLSQDKDRPEVIAKAKVADISEELNLTGDQQRSLFRAYTAHYSNYKKHINGKDLSNATVAENKTKFDNALNASVKKALKAEQYQQWLTMQDQ